MRQGARWVDVLAAIFCAVTACSVFGQAPGMRQDLEPLRHAAEAAANNGECATAISLYQSAVSAEQDSAWAHRGLADCYRVNGSWAKAADQYEAVTKIDPADADARELALLTRRALTEQQEDVVKAGTYSAIKQFPLSWLPMPVAVSGTSAGDSGARGRNVHFSPDSTPPPTPVARSIPVRVAFSRNQYTLNEKAIRQLTEVAASISASSERPESIVVEGHTCVCGSVEANKELGGRRAEVVRDFLVSKGVITAAHITTISYGSSRPVESVGAPNLPGAVCERDAIHSENRRVVILVYGLSANTTPSPLDVSFLSRRAGTSTFVPLSDGGRLRMGDEYMIRLSAQKPVYVYVFHRQSDGTWAALAPDAAPQAGSAPLAISVEPNRDVSIPSPSKGYELDSTTGVEETIIYSRLEPDRNLESLVGKIQAAPPDKGYLSLLPPDLPDLPKPIVHNQMDATHVPNTGGTAKNPPDDVVDHHTTTSRPEKRTEGPTPAASSEPSPDKQPQEVIQPGHITKRDRNLVLKDPSTKDWPQLPANPVAFVRFDHLPK